MADRDIEPILHTGGEAALDDVSATEWRMQRRAPLHPTGRLHSMMSVLPNGGGVMIPRMGRDVKGLHSMMSVLPNGGSSAITAFSAALAALDDVSATEWRYLICRVSHLCLKVRCTR